MRPDYQATITRDTPGCILFVLDVSASMGEAFEEGVTRAAFLADAVNRTLTEIAASCKQREATLHRFDVGVLAYSTGEAKPVLCGPLAGRDLVPIGDLAAHPLDVEKRNRVVPDGAGGVVEVPVAFPVWFRPESGGATAMCSALRKAAKVVADWCGAHPESFPPIVMHITDGEATDGRAEDVVKAAGQITEKRTRDGFALLLNLHVAGGKEAVQFPWNNSQLPTHPFARALFEASSALPPPLLERGFRQGFPVQAGSRGYIYNAGMKDVVAFLDIGTRAATDRVVVAIER